MKNFEEVYKELGKLFIEKLPTYIEKINEKRNDGLIIKPFNNTSLEENCIKQTLYLFFFLKIIEFFFKNIFKFY